MRGRRIRPRISRGIFFTQIVFRKAFFVGLFGSAGIGILLLVISSQSDIPEASAKKQPAELPDFSETKSPLLIKMFSYTKVDDYGLSTILQADLLEVRPRRLMAFNARSVNEAALRNARITFYNYEQNEPADDLSDFFDYECPPPCIETSRTDSGRISPLEKSTADSARIRPLGRVTRLVADKITIELYRDDQKIVTLKAETALINKKKEGVKFFNATLQDGRSSRFIRSRKIVWDRKRNVFIIPGHYSDTGASGSVNRSAVEVDMDFMVTPFG